MTTPTLLRVAVTAAVALPLGLLVATRAVEAQDAPLRILVSNDDGIESPGIGVLAESLSAIGEVTVVAPCGERSGSSMAIALAQPIRLRTFADRAVDSFCVDTSPAGAVMFGVEVLSPEGGFDVVVSGINRGANVGDLSHMSGTVGAAMMGAYQGLPSVAASLGGRGGSFEYPAEFVTEFVEWMMDEGPEAGIVYSINFPTGDRDATEGVEVAPMGGSYLKIGYEETGEDDGDRVFEARFRQPDPYPVGSDSEAYTEGYITITPLRFDWTAVDLVRALSELDWSASLDGGN